MFSFLNHWRGLEQQSPHFMWLLQMKACLLPGGVILSVSQPSVLITYHGDYVVASPGLPKLHTEQCLQFDLERRLYNGVGSPPSSHPIVDAHPVSVFCFFLRITTVPRMGTQQPPTEDKLQLFLNGPTLIKSECYRLLWQN